MLFARPLRFDTRVSLQPAFDRLGLPEAAQDYIIEKIPQYQLLLTGLQKHHGRLLKALNEQQDSPGREDFPLYIPADLRTRPGSGLLAGRKDQLERLVQKCVLEENCGDLAQALRAALLADGPPKPVTLGKRRLVFGERTFLMGVVNVTPDSFSDGGRYARTDDAVAHGLSLAEAGADILDVGGESTRPGAAEVSLDEELSRVIPVIEVLRERTEVPLSVDTFKSEVAQEALRAGAVLVNDVTGFHADPKVALVAAKAGAALCAMHIQGTPRTMQQAPTYGDVVDEVLIFLTKSLTHAEQAGVPRSRVLVDPGIGFGKKLGHNLYLLRSLPQLRVLGCPVLVGTSRKAFIGTLTGKKEPGQRLAGTLGSAAVMAVMGGADVVRVHDVAETKDVLAVADAVARARQGGLLTLGD